MQYVYVQKFQLWNSYHTLFLKRRIFFTVLFNICSIMFLLENSGKYMFPVIKYWAEHFVRCSRVTILFTQHHINTQAMHCSLTPETNKPETFHFLDLYVLIRPVYI